MNRRLFFWFSRRLGRLGAAGLLLTPILVSAQSPLTASFPMWVDLAAVETNNPRGPETASNGLTHAAVPARVDQATPANSVSLAGPTNEVAPAKPGSMNAQGNPTNAVARAEATITVAPARATNTVTQAMTNAVAPPEATVSITPAPGTNTVTLAMTNGVAQTSFTNVEEHAAPPALDPYRDQLEQARGLVNTRQLNIAEETLVKLLAEKVPDTIRKQALLDLGATVAAENDL